MLTPKPPTISLVSLLLATLIGCSEGVGPSQTDAVDAHFRVLGGLYGSFLGEHGGRPPSSEKQFVGYLESARARWEDFAASPEDLLESPRDRAPLVILYGADFERQADARRMWAGYEKQGVDGRRKAFNARGGVEEFDEQQIGVMFPQS